MTPKFSVIVPMYNAEKYIAGCIRSVLAQTYQDFELILIDDGSLDHTVEIAKQLAGRRGNVTCVTKEHTGQSDTRNKGIAIAKGEYIIFLDADDYFGERHLEHLEKSLNGSDMCISNSNFYLRKGSVIPFVLFQFEKGRDYDVLEAQEIVTDPSNFLPGATWLNVYRSRFLTEKNIHFVPMYTCAEDMDFFFQAMVCAQKICFCGTAQYYYRLGTPNSVVNSMDVSKMYSWIRICKKWFDFFREYYSDTVVGKHVIYRMRNDTRYLIDEMHRADKNTEGYARLKQYLLSNPSLLAEKSGIGQNFYFQYYAAGWGRKIKGYLKQMRSIVKKRGKNEKHCDPHRRDASGAKCGRRGRRKSDNDTA